MMLTYQKAKEIFQTARFPERGKPLANNTRLIFIPDHELGPSYAVRFHATNVVTIHPDESYTLKTNGWHTVTTWKRIRDYSPAGDIGNEGVGVGNKIYPFRENMRITNKKILTPEILRPPRIIEQLKTFEPSKLFWISWSSRWKSVSLSPKICGDVSWVYSSEMNEWKYRTPNLWDYNIHLRPSEKKMLFVHLHNKLWPHRKQLFLWAMEGNQGARKLSQFVETEQVPK